MNTIDERIKVVASRIAARSGVSPECVIAAYRNAARGAAVNAKSLFIA